MGGGLADWLCNNAAALTWFDFATYPNACIVDGISGDGGLWRNTTIAPATCNTGAGLLATAPATCALPHAGALVAVGGSTNLTVQNWDMNLVRVNNRYYTFN